MAGRKAVPLRDRPDGGVGVASVNTPQRRAESALERLETLPEVTPGPFATRTIATIERIATRALGVYGEAVESGAVNPSTIPLGVGILLTKRLELNAEATQALAPTTAPAASALAALLTAPPDPSVLRLPPGHCLTVPSADVPEAPSPTPDSAKSS